MLFNSMQFIVFFPVVCLVYFIVPTKIRYIWLLVCSYYFYMCWNPKYVLLLLFSTVVTYICGILLEFIKNLEVSYGKKIKLKKASILICFIVNTGILLYYKYFEFLFQNIEYLLSRLGVSIREAEFDIILPVGISFFIFQALGYIIDVYRDELEAEKNILKYALFISFFPQLVAGPIERAKKILVQIGIIHRFSFNNLKEGLLKTLWGFVLKLVIADRIAIIVDTVYKNSDTYLGIYIIVATVLFAFQIYCDFNGYTMIARGCAQILGYELMENFDAPYLSGSVAEFWKKWHISLTSWFRDYLYIPLGGNRKGKMRQYLNIFIVFLCSGLWHGASWSYVIWGGLNGLYQIAGDILQPVRNLIVEKCGINRNSFSHKLLKQIATFIMIDFTWLFFRMNDIGKAVNAVSSMIYNVDPAIVFNGSLYGLGLGEAEFKFMLLMLVVLLFVDLQKKRNVCILGRIMEQGIWFQAMIFATLFWIVVMYGVYGNEYEASQFIYFQF